MGLQDDGTYKRIHPPVYIVLYLYGSHSQYPAGRIRGLMETKPVRVKCIVDPVSNFWLLLFESFVWIIKRCCLQRMIVLLMDGNSRILNSSGVNCLTSLLAAIARIIG